METSHTQSETAATSPSAPGAGNYNIPGEESPKDDVLQDDSKFKEAEEESFNTDTEMLTISDSTLEQIPCHLQKILKCFDVNDSKPADLIIALIYGFALECSFADTEKVQRFSKELDKNTSNITVSAFHSQFVKMLSIMPKDIYDASKMVYSIRLQLYFDPTATLCRLTGILTGDLLILTLTPDCTEGSGKSICLSIGRYVLNLKGRKFPSRFRKLPELSYKLREFVFVPIRKEIIMATEDVFPYPSLDGLPEELYPNLYNYMNRNGLNKMANVSKRLSNTVTYYKNRLLKKRKK